MGLFPDKSDDAYRKAADAVRAGTATPDQRQLNDKATKIAGPFGQRARDAMK